MTFLSFVRLHRDFVYTSHHPLVAQGLKTAPANSERNATTKRRIAKFKLKNTPCFKGEVLSHGLG
jgi:hypothetical protein